MRPSRPAGLCLSLVTSLALCLALASCTTTTSANVTQQIYVADQAVTSIVNSADAALNAKLITKAQAQSVSTIAHQVAPLLDSARVAVEASDTTGATKTMQLVNSLLAGLQTYIPKAPPVTEPPAPVHPDSR